MPCKDYSRIWYLASIFGSFGEVMSLINRFKMGEIKSPSGRAVGSEDILRGFQVLAELGFSLPL